LSGLRMICKHYGGMIFREANGKEVRYIWDYKRDMPVLESEMIADKKAYAESERLKWMRIKAEVDKHKQESLF